MVLVTLGGFVCEHLSYYNYKNQHLTEYINKLLTINI